MQAIRLPLRQNLYATDLLFLVDASTQGDSGSIQEANAPHLNLQATASAAILARLAIHGRSSGTSKIIVEAGHRSRDENAASDTSENTILVR